MVDARPQRMAGVYARLRQLARPYRGLLLLSLLGMVLEAAAGAGFTWIMAPITDETFIARNPQSSVWLPLAIVALFLLRGVAGYVADMCSARAGRSIARDMRITAFGKYLRLPGLRFDSEPVPQMLVKLDSDSDHVAKAVVDAARIMLQQSLQIIAMLGVMLYYSWSTTLMMLVLAPPLAWVMDRVGRRYRRISHRIQQSSGALMQAAEQALSSQQEVKVYGAQPGEQARYTEQANHHLALSMKVESTRSISSALVQIMGAVGLAFLLVFAGREAMAGRLTAGGFVALMTSMMAIIPALKQLTNVQNMLQRGVASAERLFELMDADDEPDAGAQHVTKARGLLEFRDVGMQYPGQERPALQSVTFTARPGTVTAIVGRSGGGKSTLVKLIPRFYDPVAGQILLDGIPLPEYRLADLRRQIALVGQQVMLFDNTVAANVAYGEMAGSEPARVREAIVAANAQGFVDALPEGIDTSIGARGGRLSGGQRQRLAIARAILKDAPILILDEATAALDNESERLVQEALNRLMPDRTTLVIAHRLSTIEKADRILVMDEGRLVEQGTHAELLAAGGVYAHLHQVQFRDATDGEADTGSDA